MCYFPVLCFRLVEDVLSMRGAGEMLVSGVLDIVSAKGSILAWCILIVLFRFRAHIDIGICLVMVVL